MLNGCAYILTVDVGNTFIRFGLFAEDSAAAQECPLATCEITPPSSITADEARMRLMQVMGALAADAGVPGVLAPAAAVLSCVVPALERPWKAALSRTCTGRVLTVGPGLKTGIPVHYDDPAEIGPDRIADAVAARAVYGSPCIVIDLGTTTNIEVIDVHGTFVGGVIAPGLALGARSLSAAAARLPQVEPSAPTHVIGRNTREAMRSGVVLGEVARIDGMLDMVLAEMRATKAAGEGDVPIVITGDDAEALAARGWWDKRPYLSPATMGQTIAIAEVSAMSDDLHQTASGKRRDVISWDEFFMSVAIAAQRRSKDPNTQVGACIASTNHRILSVGYNGTPSALNDDFFPWGTSDDPLQDKHNYVVHAEANAVLNYRGSLKDLEGSTVYVTLFPCHDCAKILAQVGVGEVVYLDNKYADTDDGRISRRILDSCGISYRQVIVDVQIGTGGQARQ